ncbi:MAG TPA: MOSC N-terminal beta barrel domain-containing protein [Ginsengibacter sp.]|nr:MOSC N-terminal beta barrel domain-containing protein [Ginsengibacter sp.]
MLIVSELFVYPVKSLSGISVSSAKVTDRGFEYDRRWMLVDLNNRFLTQREFPEMALLQVELTAAGLKVFHKKNIHSQIDIPFIPETTEEVTAEIFEENCKVIFVSKTVDKWFSQMLAFECRLVYMHDSSKRFVDEKYAINNEITSLSDGYPFLLVGQSSLDDLNKRLINPLPVNRFRPNMVFTGAEPYEEDFIAELSINNIIFYGVKPCGRCTITTVDQDDASKSKEPLKTLATYRERNNKIYFGQNLLAKGVGSINIGDQIKIIKLNNVLTVL